MYLMRTLHFLLSFVPKKGEQIIWFLDSLCSLLVRSFAAGILSIRAQFTKEVAGSRVINKTRYFFLLFASAIQIIMPVYLSSRVFADVNTVRPIVFPVLGGGSYSNDFYAARADGIHHATDILNFKHRELVAVMDGVVTHVVSPQASWGYSITIRDDEGYNYRYIHMNNDTPGTDNGAGGEMNAYAPDMRSGNRVVKGQHIGWLGDSGNAETTTPHLHFEIYDGNGQYINPYFSLNQAPRLQSVVQHPPLSNEFLPYGHRPLGVNIAMGNLDGDAASEIVTGVSFKGGPHVRTFDDDNQPMAFNQFVFDPNFQGGVDVATGDVDGDNIDEIITSTGPGAGPHVRVLRMNGQVLAEFYAYSPTFKGGVRVAAGDLDGDGKDEIITGPWRDMGPRVKAFKLDGTIVADFMAYSPTFLGGIDVSSGDVLGDTKEEIITASGSGESGFVRVLTVDGAELSRIYAYNPAYKGGVRVSVGNVRLGSSKAEIVTVPENAGAPHLAMFNGAGTQILDEEFFIESWWRGYHDVAAGRDFSKAATGVNRRGSVKPGLN